MSAPPGAARAAALIALVLSVAAPAVPGGRVGFVDDFSSAEGWQAGVWPGTTGLASITSDGGQTTFATVHGSFLTGESGAWAPNWPDWDRNAAPGLAMVVKKHPVRVDLDRYHFLVARTTHSGTYMALALNGWDTKVCYTTGLHSVDLRDIPQPSLRGEQPVEVRLTFLNTGEKVVLDELRLVESLSPEEEAGFVPAGLSLRMERLEPAPYHGLAALNARAGSPVRFDFPSERAVFRDTSTGAEVWRLTRSVRTESCDGFSPDGSVLPILNRNRDGMTLYDFDAGGLRVLENLRGAPAFSRAAPSVVYLYGTAPVEGKTRVTITAANFRTGAAETVAEWLSEDEGMGEFGMSGSSELLILGLKEGRALYLIDPRVEDPAKRMRRVPLPMRMKGAFLSAGDAAVNWQRCYYFERWTMDLATGEVGPGAYPTYGGHEILGRDTFIGRYGGLMLAHRLGVPPLDEARAAEVRIWSNWTAPLPSDYGQLSADDRWLATNGTEGEVAGKRLLIDGREPGTVLQVVHDFTSRNSWDSNTYTRVSPDATKLAYMSDMLGDTDVYVAVARRPAAPRGLALSEEGGRVRLRWEAPEAAREVRGYNVYRGAASGRGYERINADLVAGNEFVDRDPPETACYAVVAEEHSGLEGLYSDEAIRGAPPACRIHAEIEEGRLAPPLRQRFDGACGGFRCARVWRETPAESVGACDLRVRVPAEGGYTAWLRAKGAGRVEIRAGRQKIEVAIGSPEWSWVRVPVRLTLPAGPHDITIASDSDGLCLDRLILAGSASDVPQGIDDRDPAPSPVKGLRVAAASVAEVRLSWTPSDAPDLDHYSVYVGETEGFEPDNASLLSSGRAPEALDSGFRPGGTLTYKVVAVNRRGAASAPAAVRVRTPKLAAATIELSAAGGALSGGLALGETRGIPCAFLPAPLGKGAPPPTITWKYKAPREGTYWVWARYATYDARRVSTFRVEADGNQKVNGTDWRLRMPCTLTRHLGGVSPGEETFFADKMMSGFWAGPFDSLDLSAGTHTISFAFEPDHAPGGPRLAAVHLSNDPSFRPPGFDPRIDFVK